jgi:hypothetical protein
VRPARIPILVTPVLAACAIAAGPASAAQQYHRHHQQNKPVKLRVITPGPGDLAGAGGAFNVDLSLQARNSAGNDWQVGVPGFFGLNKRATLTAYVVRGTAPGTVPASGLNPISNVVRHTFTIAN